MQSNTKLTNTQKNELKEYKESIPKSYFINNEKVTLCIVEPFSGSNMLMVSVSIMSDNEKKYRRKVGEYHAMMRMEFREFIQIPRWTDLWEFMDCISV